MCDYIPLDQAVIDQEVERLAQQRRSAKIYLAREIKNAGGNYDIIVFRNDRKNVIRALEDLKIFWCEIDREILVSRHEIYDAVLPKE